MPQDAPIVAEADDDDDHDEDDGYQQDLTGGDTGSSEHGDSVSHHSHRRHVACSSFRTNAQCEERKHCIWMHKSSSSSSSSSSSTSRLRHGHDSTRSAGCRERPNPATATSAPDTAKLLPGGKEPDGNPSAVDSHDAEEDERLTRLYTSITAGLRRSAIKVETRGMAKALFRSRAVEVDSSRNKNDNVHSENRASDEYADDDDDDEEEEEEEEDADDEDDYKRNLNDFKWSFSASNLRCIAQDECVQRQKLKSSLGGLAPRSYSTMDCCMEHPGLRIMAQAAAEFFDSIGFSDWWMDGDLLDAMTIFKGRLPPWTHGRAQLSFAIDKSSSSTSPMRLSRRKFVSTMLGFNQQANFLPFVLRTCTVRKGSSQPKTAVASAATARRRRLFSAEPWLPSNRMNELDKVAARCSLYSKASSIPKDRVVVRFELSHMDEDDGAKLVIVPAITDSACTGIMPSGSTAFSMNRPMPVDWILPTRPCQGKFYGRPMRCPAHADLYKDAISGMAWRTNWWVDGAYRRADDSDKSGGGGGGGGGDGGASSSVASKTRKLSGSSTKHRYTAADVQAVAKHRCGLAFAEP